MTATIPNILASIAPTLFGGGPSDIVATPDVYGISSSNVINSPVGKFNGFDGSILNNLKSGSFGSLASLTNIAASLLGLPGNVTIGAAGIANRLGGAAGQPIGSLPSSLQSLMGQSVQGQQSSFGLLNTVINGVESNTVTGDMASALAVLGLVNQVTGNATTVSYTDVGASSTVLSAITTSLIGLGLGAAVAALVTAPGTSTAAVNSALKANVAQAIAASDLATVQLCITTLGVGGVTSQVPNAALLLMSGYKLPTGTPATSYAAIYAQLLSIIRQLAPTFDTVIRQTVDVNKTVVGVAVLSLKYFASASADVLTLFKTDPAFATQCAIAKAYPSVDIVTALKTEYPAMLKL
jgi:hypothetical protein